MTHCPSQNPNGVPAQAFSLREYGVALPLDDSATLHMDYMARRLWSAEINALPTAQLEVHVRVFHEMVLEVGAKVLQWYSDEHVSRHHSADKA